MPKYLSNAQARAAALMRGAQYSDGTPIKRFVPPITEVVRQHEPEPAKQEPPASEAPIIVVERDPISEKILAALEALPSQMPVAPQPKPRTWFFTVTQRDYDGRVVTFKVTEQENV